MSPGIGMQCEPVTVFPADLFIFSASLAAAAAFSTCQVLSIVWFTNCSIAIRRGGGVPFQTHSAMASLR
jgi:hypothetical protein